MLGGEAKVDIEAVVELIKSRAPEVEEKYAYLKSWVEMKNIISEGFNPEGQETDL